MDQAVALTRRAVRRLLEGPGCSGDALAVAVSGGADSLALAAAAEHVGHRLGRTVHGLIVDHGLQPDSRNVAERTAKQLHGLDSVHVLPVTVDGPGGPEAAARRARYAALRTTGHDLILLGHTRDDQAETVLLGLGRGSGPRSIAGMRALDPPWGRPFLDVPREATIQACRALNLAPWSDPHNNDARFTRARLRHEVLPLLEDVLQQGVAEALARTARQLQEDADALDVVAEQLRERAQVGGELSVEILATAPKAIRRRVVRAWLRAAGARELTDAHLRSVDALIGEWRGQGGVWVAGGLEVSRAHGRLRVGTPRES